MPYERCRTSRGSSSARISLGARNEKFFPSWSIALHRGEECADVPRPRVPRVTTGDGIPLATTRTAKSERGPKERRASFQERQQGGCRFSDNRHVRDSKR